MKFSITLSSWLWWCGQQAGTGRECLLLLERDSVSRIQHSVSPYTEHQAVTQELHKVLYEAVFIQGEEVSNCLQTPKVQLEGPYSPLQVFRCEASLLVGLSVARVFVCVICIKYRKYIKFKEISQCKYCKYDLKKF